MTKLYLFTVPNSVITGYVETKEEIPEEADGPVKEVDVHPAQLDWMNEAFSEFTSTQEYLMNLMYAEEQTETMQ